MDVPALETEPQFESEGEASFETTPIVVDGVMYVGSPLGRVIALDARRGRRRSASSSQHGH